MGGECAGEAIIQGPQPNPMQEPESHERPVSMRDGH